MLSCGPRKELLLCCVGISVSCNTGLLANYSFSQVLQGGGGRGRGETGRDPVAAACVWVHS